MQISLVSSLFHFIYFLFIYLFIIYVQFIYLFIYLFFGLDLASSSVVSGNCRVTLSRALAHGRF